VASFLAHDAILKRRWVSGNHPGRVMRDRPGPRTIHLVSATRALTYVGHSTVLLELSGVRLLTDPLLRSRVAHLRRDARPPTADVWERIDAVLISHLHYDHLDMASLRIVRAPRVLVPRGAGGLLHRARIGGVEELGVGDVVEVGNVRVEAVPADHDDRRRPGGVHAEPLGFVLGRAERIYFAGDTDVFEGMARLAPIDVALLPVAGWGPKLGPGHMNAAGAARAAALLRPRVAVPIHWGTFRPRTSRPGGWFTEPALAFASSVAELAPEVDVRVLDPGASLALA
jgi:L-ascorbate metabolism protein UlaG (beta-lactamase superfamily)